MVEYALATGLEDVRVNFMNSTNLLQSYYIADNDYEVHCKPVS